MQRDRWHRFDVGQGALGGILFGSGRSESYANNGEFGSARDGGDKPADPSASLNWTAV